MLSRQVKSRMVYRDQLFTTTDRPDHGSSSGLLKPLKESPLAVGLPSIRRSLQLPPVQCKLKSSLAKAYGDPAPARKQRPKDTKP